jgi:hypothetical protein
MEQNIQDVMRLVQEYACTWSSVGGPFDSGDTLQRSIDAKAEVEGRMRELLKEASAQDSRVLELEAENDRLRQVLSEKIVTSTMLTEMNIIKGGVNMGLEGGAAQLLAGAFADQFRDSGAANYLELTFTSGDLPLLVTLQRQDGKTPSQFRKEAEAKVAELEKLARDACESWRSKADMFAPIDAIGAYFDRKNVKG